MDREQHHLKDCATCTYEFINPFDSPCNKCGLMYRYYEERIKND